MTEIIYHGDFKETRVNLEGGILFKKGIPTKVSQAIADILIPRSDFKGVYGKAKKTIKKDEDEE